MALGKMTIAAAASLLLGKVVDAVPCLCAETWSSPTKGCESVEGCPAVSCDGISKPWCKVAPGLERCDQEAMILDKEGKDTGEGEGWTWCEQGASGTGTGIFLDKAFAGNPDKECHDVLSNDTEFLRCYRSVTWAKNVGIDSEPSFYIGYGLTNESSFVDFQCALSDMVGKGDLGDSAKNGQGSEGHGCPVPCSSSLEQCTAASPMMDKGVTTTPAVTTTTTVGSGSSSFPWWAWLLLVGLLLLLGAGIAYFMLRSGEKKPKKKKRATKTVAKKAEPAPEPAKAPEVPVAPAVITAPPVYITSPQAVYPTTYSTAAPMAQYVAQAAPAQYAQYATPIQTLSSAMPVQAMATPIQQATSVYQQAVPTFA